jgi:hypothetical protein
MVPRLLFPSVLKLPPYTLAGYDLTTHSFSLLCDMQRLYIPLDNASRASLFLDFGLNLEQIKMLSALKVHGSVDDFEFRLDTE